MTWQILIATVIDRRHLFVPLHAELQRQIDLLGLSNEVSILYEEDNKEISVGAKRQLLLDRSSAEYINFMDSDDFPKDWYVKELFGAMQSKPDCVGMKIAMTTNGVKPETCIHSLRNDHWYTKGSTHYRNVTHFNPIKRELALQVGFPNLRFGEDKHYSDRVSLLCKKEVFIDKFMFDYRYSNKEEHSKKYGIK